MKYSTLYFKIYSTIILFIFCSIYVLNNALLLPVCMLIVNSICIIDKHVYEHPNADNPFFIPFKIYQWIYKHIPESNVSNYFLEKVKTTYFHYDSYLEQYSLYTTIKKCLEYLKKHIIVILLIIKDGMIQQSLEMIALLANRIGGPIGNIILSFGPKLSTTNVKRRVMDINEDTPLLSLDSSDDSDSSDEMDNRETV